MRRKQSLIDREITQLAGVHFGKKMLSDLKNKISRKHPLRWSRRSK